jgi:osmotically-inducible protein OsmY
MHGCVVAADTPKPEAFVLHRSWQGRHNMQTPQLFCIVGAMAVAAGCSRAETEARKDQASAEVRTTAVTARERVADAWLVTKIQSQYFVDNDVKARDIQVSARDGAVTLKGRVDSAAEHEQAVQIAKTTDGVIRVVDRLAGPAAASPAAHASPGGAVATSGSGDAAATVGAAPMHDAQVTAGVQSKFFVDDRLRGRRIEVETQQGVVTLQGTVASENERAQALFLARTAEGVQRVEDHLAVDASLVSGGQAPVATDDVLVTTIQSEFFLDDAVKHASIEVSAKDGVVLLQGTVPTETARQHAIAIARTTEGVVQVVDRLVVRKS